MTVVRLSAGRMISMQPDEGVGPRCAGKSQGTGETVAEFAVAGREGANAAKEGLSIAECPYKRPDQHLRRRAWVSGYAAARTEIRTASDSEKGENDSPGPN